MVGKRAEKELTTVEKDVTVTKRLETDEYPIPTIAFAIESKRTDQVTIQLVDTVPETINVETLGFHPEHGREHWRVESDKIVFEYELAPEETYYTVYGIGDEEAPIEPFLDELQTIAVTPTREDGEPTALSEDIPNIDSEAKNERTITADGETSAPLSLMHPDETESPSQTAGEITDNQGTGEDADYQIMDQADTSIVDKLVTELENKDPSEEQLGRLRNQLSLRNGSMDARVSKLQSEIAELEAYTDTLEQFLDKNGTGADLIEDVQDRIATLEDEVDELRATGEQRDAQLESVEESLAALDDETEKTDEALQDFTTDLEAVQSRLDDLENEVPDGEITAEPEALRTDMEEIRDWKEQVIAAFGSTLDQEDAGEDT